MRSRTSNLLIRSQPLYPIELRVRTGPETRNGPAERQDRFSGIIEARREFGLGIGPQLRNGNARRAGKGDRAGPAAGLPTDGAVRNSLTLF